MNLIGVDGCKAGWLVATSDTSLTSLDFHIAPDFRSIIASLENDSQVVVDIPIGLAEDGTRACDKRARQVVGKRRSSVFPTPCREAFPATTYKEACALNLAACGKSMSQQTFNILTKIAEVDRLMTPAMQTFIRESHPEVIFAMLAGTDQGLCNKKKSKEGAQERLSLLALAVPPFNLEGERVRLGRGNVARDDIIDAVACLVAAHRIVTRVALSLPEGDEQRDACGLRMEIVA